MHEKKLALPYLARAEQQALKVGIFITTKLQIFDYHFEKKNRNKSLKEIFDVELLLGCQS